MTSKAKKTPARNRGSVSQAGPVDALLDEMVHPQRPLIDALRHVIARAVPTATESVKWNAPSFATKEHFATLHLRAKGIQLILHLGAKARPDMNMRNVLGETTILEWKGAQRAVVTVLNSAHLKAQQIELARILKIWIRHVA